MLSHQKFFFKKYKKIRARSLTTGTGRASFLFSFFGRLRASMTVEASLVLPLFLFYMMTLLYSLEIVRFQSDVSQALFQEITREGFGAYSAGYEGDESATGEATKQNIRAYLEEQILPYLCVEGGREGLHIDVRENILGADNRQLEVSYRIKSFLYLLPIGDMEVKDCVWMHDWTGYQEFDIGNGDKQEEVYVFVTPTGKKYHFSAECTYLRVRLQAMNLSEAEKKRNRDGEIYRPCEVCGGQGASTVYLTEWGNRYHTGTACRAIKKTVYRVPLWQTEGRTACSKCKNEYKGAKDAGT